MHLHFGFCQDSYYCALYCTHFYRKVHVCCQFCINLHRNYSIGTKEWKKGKLILWFSMNEKWDTRGLLNFWLIFVWITKDATTWKDAFCGLSFPHFRSEEFLCRRYASSWKIISGEIWTILKNPFIVIVLWIHYLLLLFCV